MAIIIEHQSLTGKTRAQSEPPISILPARARAISGHRANGLTQSIPCPTKILAPRFTLTLVRRTRAPSRGNRASQ
jgi:hypothetical protein